MKTSQIKNFLCALMMTTCMSALSQASTEQQEQVADKHQVQASLTYQACCCATCGKTYILVQEIEGAWVIEESSGLALCSHDLMLLHPWTFQDNEKIYWIAEDFYDKKLDESLLNVNSRTIMRVVDSKKEISTQEKEYKEFVERQDRIKSIMLIKKNILMKKTMLAAGGLLTLWASGSYLQQDETLLQAFPQDAQAARKFFQGGLKLAGACLAGITGLIAASRAVMSESKEPQITDQPSLQELQKLEQALVREKKNLDQGMMGTAGMATIYASAGYILHTLADDNVGFSSIPAIIGAASVAAVGGMCTLFTIVSQ